MISGEYCQGDAESNDLGYRIDIELRMRQLSSTGIANGGLSRLSILPGMGARGFSGVKA